MLFGERVADVFTYIGYSVSRCGYCGHDDTFHSFGIWAHSLSVASYKALLDRGWRRSGLYLYRPNLRRSCCKLYTIKLKSAEFKADRKHRQALHKLNRFVLGEDESKRDGAKRSGKAAPFDLAETVHLAESSRLQPDTNSPHRFEVTMEPSSFTEAKFAVYKKYQIAIHGDKENEIKPSGFKRFLCQSPLQTEPSETSSSSAETTGAGSSPGYGSFHQVYKLDGQIIALAVLDLLPGCVSSIYFAYDPSFGHLSLGRVSACRETLLSLEPGYGEYYMGYYVPDCPKMRYKGEYRPSLLLDPKVCPEDATEERWRPLEAFQEAWKEGRGNGYFCSFIEQDDDGRTAEDEDGSSAGRADLATPGTIYKLGMPGITPLERCNALVRGRETLVLADGGVTYASVSRPWRRHKRVNEERVRDMVATMGDVVMGNAILALND